MAISYGRQRWWLFIASHIIDWCFAAGVFKKLRKNSQVLDRAPAPSWETKPTNLMTVALIPFPYHWIPPRKSCCTGYIHFGADCYSYIYNVVGGGDGIGGYKNQSTVTCANFRFALQIKRFKKNMHEVDNAKRPKTTTPWNNAVWIDGSHSLTVRPGIGASVLDLSKRTIWNEYIPIKINSNSSHNMCSLHACKAMDAAPPLAAD